MEGKNTESNICKGKTISSVYYYTINNYARGSDTSTGIVWMGNKCSYDTSENSESNGEARAQWESLVLGDRHMC